MNYKFDSLSELYNYLYPALTTKVNEFKENNFIIKEINLWNYLLNKIWIYREKLTIYDLVSDIMRLKKEDLINPNKE